MRTVRRIVIPVIAVAVALVAVPVHTSAASQMMFRATLTETGPTDPNIPYIAPCPSNQTRYICVNVAGKGYATIGTGHATHLVAISEVAVVHVDTTGGSGPVVPGCAPEVRTSTLIAANGASITLQGPGLVCGDTIQASGGDSWVVISGTGRFAHAVGHGSNSVTIDRTVFPATSVTTFTGLLSR